MSFESKFALLAVLLLILTSCAGAFTRNDVEAVTDSIVLTSLQYVEGPEVGPPYSIALTVPDEWVGEFETRNIGNVVHFDYVGADSRAEIFTIEALSEDQYWRQAGSYPGSYVNIVNRGDTYFIYYLPIDAYYSGLPEAEYEGFAAAVPDVIASFEATAE